MPRVRRAGRRWRSPRWRCTSLYTFAFSGTVCYTTSCGTIVVNFSFEGTASCFWHY